MEEYFWLNYFSGWVGLWLPMPTDCMMKNLKYNAAGGIDCLYNHYLYGYIPITIDPNDKDTSELYAEAVSGKHGAIAAADVVAVTAQKNALIFAEILKLESNQVRPVRELLIDPFNGFAKSKLADIDIQISALRAQILL